MEQIKPLSRHEIVVFEKFAFEQFYILNIGPKEDNKDVGNFHFSDSPVGLFSINQATGECRVITMNGDLETFKITSPQTEVKEGENIFYLVPGNDHNHKIFDQILKSCGPESYQHVEAIRPLIKDLMYFNVQKYMF